MTQIFAALYLDEDVDVLLATLLRTRGFKAVTSQESGNVAATDWQQLAYAASLGSVLLTHNRCDFELLADRDRNEGKQHAGIFIAVRRTPHNMLNRLLTLLNQFTADELANNVWYL